MNDEGGRLQPTGNTNSIGCICKYEQFVKKSSKS